MKIYLLIHEQDTDTDWGCDVKLFADKQAALDAMRQEWEKTAALWEYDSREHGCDDECECRGNTAVIRDGGDVEHWRVEEQELPVPVSVAAEVSGSVVQNAYAKGGDVDVGVLPSQRKG